MNGQDRHTVSRETPQLGFMKPRKRTIYSRWHPRQLSQVCARSWNRFFHGYPVVGACASGLLTLIEGPNGGSRHLPLGGGGGRRPQPQDLAGGFNNLGVTCGERLPDSMRHKGIGFAPSEGAGVYLAQPRRGAWELVAHCFR